MTSITTVNTSPTNATCEARCSRTGAPAVTALAGLRDPELTRLGLRGEQVVFNDVENYRCTRRWRSPVGPGHGGTAGGG